MRSFLFFLVAAATAVACSGAQTNAVPDAGVDAGTEGGVAADSGAVDTGHADASSPDASDGGVKLDAPDDGEAGCADPALQVAPPTFDPPPGRYGCGGVSVTLATSTPGARILYTTDGTNPGPTSTPYQAPIWVGPTKNIRAYATAPCMQDSTITWGTYEVSLFPGPSSPQAIPTCGTYHAPVAVTFSAGLDGNLTCYTLDGSAATCSATCSMDVADQCTGGSKTYDPKSPIAIDGTVSDPKTGQVTLNAVQCESGNGSIAAKPVDYVLQVDPVAIAPAVGTAVPATGTLSGVQITENGPATDAAYASICWSTDGTSVPDCTCSGATPADAPATVGPGLYVSKGNATPVMQVQRAQGASGITVRAVGCATGYAPSDAPYASVTWQ